MKEKKSISILIIVFAVVIVALAVFLIQLVTSTKDTTAIEKTEDESIMTEKWSEGVISYNGKHYKYNENLKNYLLMGIDKDGEVTKAKNYQDGGQSDAMFLLVEDTENMDMKIVFINRNAMTTIQIYDEEGNSLGSKEAQICTQHGFGDGKKLSCNLATEAVSNMFYQLPIDGYMALNISGVPALNDFVGGVELEILPGLAYLNDNELVEGQTVTLNGQQAYTYLRKRNTDEFGSADLRLARQQQYMNLFVPKLMEKINSGNSQALALYQSISAYLVSNIDAETIINELAKYSYNLDETYLVPGETILGDSGYEEYHIDEEAFMEMILEVFYKEIAE